MNRFEFLGRLTKEPTIRNTQDGAVVYNGSIAVNRKYKKESETSADFFNIVAFGKQAEFMSKYFMTKGQQMLVTGRIQNRSWEDQNGEKKYATDFIVEESFFADKKQESNQENSFNSFDMSDDLPF